MKTPILTLLVILTVAAFLIVKNRSRFRPGADASAGQSETLERKLEILADCGLALATPFTAADLLTSFDRKEYEKPGFEMVLFGLGMTEEEAPWRNHCANLWNFDTECIEGDGSYRRIAERMAEITQGSLVLENIEDRVDLDKKAAWLSFSFQGRQTKIDCKVQDDWADTSILAKFVAILADADRSKVYVTYDLGGQTCLIGCVTKNQLQRLTARGVGFMPLR